MFVYRALLKLHREKQIKSIFNHENAAQTNPTMLYGLHMEGVHVVTLAREMVGFSEFGVLGLLVALLLLAAHLLRQDWSATRKYC